MDHAVGKTDLKKNRPLKNTHSFPPSPSFPFLPFQMGEVKFGELKGEDVNGNKYFENLEYPFGQHRWVEYKVRREKWREFCVGEGCVKSLSSTPP